MPRSSKLIIVGILLVGIALFVGIRYETTAIAECDVSVSKEMLQESLALGTGFILANQKPAGNFEYEYDWINKTYNPEDNSVRQAGALWGLALIYAHTRDAKLLEPIERGLAFFERYSKVRTDGARYVIYPGETDGSLGTVALAALAHIEYLNAHEADLSEEALTHQKDLLDGYLRFISTAVTRDKLFAGSYDMNGISGGRPSSYSDGESLLTLVKAARYRGYPQWEQQVKELANAGYAINVKQALKDDPDSDTTKGYYQWSSMAYRELAESGWDDTEKYGEYAIDLADWMIDTHKVLTRTRNTGYAFEGILSAYAVANDRGDKKHAQKFRCAAETGLSKLTSWQLGNPAANTFITSQFEEDSKALATASGGAPSKAWGGIQNAANEPLLRIDVTQHQMHAVIFALEEIF